MNSTGIIRLGPEPFARDAKGQLATRIGTVFLRTPALVTIRGIHAMQRMEQNQCLQLSSTDRAIWLEFGYNR